MQQLKKFIEFFHGNSNETVIRVPDRYQDSRSGKSRSYYRDIDFDDIPEENQTNDIYWGVNLGRSVEHNRIRYRDADVHTFTAAYVDIDCGRDIDGHYFDLETVTVFKQQVLADLHSFTLPASRIVFTRNGIHAYWKLAGRHTWATTWRLVQEKLIARFNGDSKAKNPARLLRCPETWWRKPDEGIEPYQVTIVEGNDASYTIDNLLDVLSDIHVETRATLPSTSRPRRKCAVTSISGNTDMVNAIVNRDVATLQARFHPEPVVFTNYADFYRHLTQEIDLEEFLGVAGKHSCCFHDGGSDSGYVLRTTEGQWFYKCHSDRCDARGNIRRVVELLLDCEADQAEDLLMDVFRLSIVESEWQAIYRKRLERMRWILLNELEDAAPMLYTNVRDAIPLLLVLIEQASNNIKDEQYYDGENDAVVFYASIRRLARSIGITSPNTINERIVTLAFHQLIERLHADDVPDHLVTEAKKVQQRSNQRCLTSFYTIPSIAGSKLIDAELLARQWKEYPLAKKSYEAVYRTFGPAHASRCFSHKKGWQLSGDSYLYTGFIHTIVMELIEQKGWCSRQEITDALAKQIGRSATSQVRKSLPETLQTYELEEIRLDKKTKAEIGFTGTGYPKIIRRQHQN